MLFARSFGFAAVILALMSFPSVGVATQGRTAEGGWTPPQTPWGDPDLQGIWTNIKEFQTPFERPSELTAGDPTSPEALKRQHEVDRASREERARSLADIPTGAAPVHWYESLDLLNDEKLKRVTPWSDLEAKILRRGGSTGAVTLNALKSAAVTARLSVTVKPPYHRRK